jgi:hypothetical protein
VFGFGNNGNSKISIFTKNDLPLNKLTGEGRLIVCATFLILTRL